MNTDVEWEKWGRMDPYFAVLTDRKFRSDGITEKAREEFFRSGERHIDRVLKVCRRHLDANFRPRTAIDFGCGTGRIVIPLARAVEHVVGLDVSPSMLAEAAKNCDRASIRNASLLQSDDRLSRVNGSYDFIHSYIVFQHIPVARGQVLFERLINHLAGGGIGAVQFTYST